MAKNTMSNDEILQNMKQQGWKQRPKTIDELAVSLEIMQVTFADLDNVPVWASLTPGHKLFLDIAQRIYDLEKKVG